MHTHGTIIIYNRVLKIVLLFIKLIGAKNNSNYYFKIPNARRVCLLYDGRPNTKDFTQNSLFPLRRQWRKYRQITTYKNTQHTQHSIQFDSRHQPPLKRQYENNGEWVKCSVSASDGFKKVKQCVPCFCEKVIRRPCYTIVCLVY